MLQWNSLYVLIMAVSWFIIFFFFSYTFIRIFNRGDVEGRVQRDRVYTPDRSPVCRRANTERQTEPVTFTPVGNLVGVHLMLMSLDFGRKTRFNQVQIPEPVCRWVTVLTTSPPCNLMVHNILRFYLGEKKVLVF